LIMLLAIIVSVSIGSVHGTATVTPSAFPSQEHARFVGAVTCQSSMCHGGASPSRDQFTIWSHNDLHSRAYASLVSAYGVNMARALHIESPTTDVTCVRCHAPLAMPGADLAPTADMTEGVTCEACHNGAAAWLRGHTRPDWTYADRVHAGMSDMRNALVRANTCVECHQTIDPKLLAAGHPKLTFELDGQAASEPRHWMEKSTWFGAKAWLVGQAVALRDVSEQIRKESATPATAADQKALLWLLQQVPSLNGASPTADQPDAVAAWSNETAKKISDTPWNAGRNGLILAALAGTSDSFRDAAVGASDQAARATRLVLALDRLFKATHPKPATADAPLPPGEPELSALFDEVQDAKAFDSGKFASDLRKFADVVGRKE
jgi:Cytochrome c554 and c-prime